MGKAVLTLLLVLLTAGIYAQSLDELREKKKKAEEELQFTNQLLEKSRENEKVSLNELRLINNKINQRYKIISALNSEINVIQSFIDNNNLVISMLSEDLVGMKKEYADMIRFAYRNRNSSDLILFLLSSHDFNQAYKRYLYLKQYTAYRKVQAETIEAVQEVLEKKLIDLNRQAQEKTKLLNAQNTEYKKLNNEKAEQDSFVKNMQKEQRTLKQRLKNQQKLDRELDQQIQDIIEEEAKKARAAGLPGYGLTPEQKLVGDNFEQNKSRLPWPVERGLITEKFGEHPHPTLKNITLNNNGIDISTEPEANARAVFNGEVSRVFAISGGNLAVIIRHGEYLTVYSNLKEVIVKAGDKVETKQIIGTVYSDSANSGSTVLKFQVWFKNQKLDPEPWIVK